MTGFDSQGPNTRTAREQLQSETSAQAGSYRIERGKRLAAIEISLATNEREIRLISPAYAHPRSCHPPHKCIGSQVR